MAKEKIDKMQALSFLLGACPRIEIVMKESWI